MVACLLVSSLSCTQTTKVGGIYYFIRENQFEQLCFGYLNSCQPMIGHGEMEALLQARSKELILGNKMANKMANKYKPNGGH